MATVDTTIRVGAPRRVALGWAFVERQTNLWKRYWAWELVWLVYGVVNTLAVTFIAKEAARTGVVGPAEVSRLTLFLGVKNIGGTQTALLGLGELFITIVLSYYLLSEVLTPMQILGAGVLGISLLMISFEKHDPQKRHPKGGWLAWIHPPEIAPIPWSLPD